MQILDYGGCDCDQGILRGGSITVPLTSSLTGLESGAWLLPIFVFICKADWFKPVKQEVNGTMILPPLVFPAVTNEPTYYVSSGTKYVKFFTLPNSFSDKGRINTTNGGGVYIHLAKQQDPCWEPDGWQYRQTPNMTKKDTTIFIVCACWQN
jgi:hypothetical protein